MARHGLGPHPQICEDTLCRNNVLKGQTSNSVQTAMIKTVCIVLCCVGIAT